MKLPVPEGTHENEGGAQKLGWGNVDVLTGHITVALPWRWVQSQTSPTGLLPPT